MVRSECGNVFTTTKRNSIKLLGFFKAKWIFSFILRVRLIQLKNEQIIDWMTQEFDCSIYPIELEKAQKGRNSIGYYALPHLIDTEGFYICVLQKK